MKEEGTFVWQDESSLTYENWADDQPNSNGIGNGRDRDCVTKSLRHGKAEWWDQQCNLDRRFVFVCSELAENSCEAADCPTTSITAAESTTTTSDCVHVCSNADFHLSGNNCFWASSYTLSFSAASSLCLTKGARLATVGNEADDNIISNLITTNDGFLDWTQRFEG